MANRSIRLPDSLDEEIQAEAQAEGKNVSEYIRDVLRQRHQLDSDDDRLDDLEQRVETLEESAAHRADRLAALEARDGPHDGADDTADGPEDADPSQPTDSLSAPAAASQRTPDAGGSGHVERGVVVKAGSLRSEAQEAAKQANVKATGQLARERREALLWAWDYLRQHDKVVASELANATFGAFWDTDLDYDVQKNQYAGRGMWQGYLREALKELPSVDPPKAHGRFWEFEEEG